jgi:hypothetical protein
MATLTGLKYKPATKIYTTNLFTIIKFGLFYCAMSSGTITVGRYGGGSIRQDFAMKFIIHRLVRV